jgi:putative ATP-binding cassette transporter
MKMIKFFFKYSPGYMALAILVGALGGISSAALMAVVNSRLSGVPPTRWTSVWSFVGLVSVVLATSYVSRVLMAHLSQWSIYDLRLRLARKVLGVPLRELEEAGLNRVLAALTQDVEQIARVFLSIPMLFVDVAVVLACFVYLGWLSLPVLAFVVVFLALAIASCKLPETKAQKLMGLAREDWDTLVGYFRALTDGVKELKLHDSRREAFLSGPLRSTAASFRRNRFNSEHIYALTRGWSQILYFLFVGVVLYGLSLFMGISTQVLVGFVVTVLFMKTNIDRIQDLLPIYAQGQASLKKIEKLGMSLEQIGASLTHGPKVEKAAGATETADGSNALAQPPARFRRLELSGLTHKYYREREESDFYLGPIDLEINSGELIFLVGGNGSGKTTLAKLLVGLYAPEAGEIRLDGRPVTNENRQWYSQHFSVVFSDFFLFDSLLGLRTQLSSLDATAHEYLVQLQLDHKVQVKDGNLSTTSLSQGQRKRLALLTAYLEDRPFYVFDEWAADQDPTFKEVFYHRLLPELKARGKTVLVISHDDRYYHVADRIIKLDYGRLTDSEVETQVYFGQAEAELVQRG